MDYNKKPKYQQKIDRFYVELLKSYEKLSIKEFKQIVDYFFANDEAFENFLATSPEFVIKNGKISWKGY